MNTEIKKDESEVTNVKNKGLPMVADVEVYRTPLIAVAVIMLAVLVVGFGVYKGKSADTQKVDEETYTISALPATEKQVEETQSAAEQVNEAKQPEISPEELQQKVMMLQEKQKEIQQRLAAPLMIVNNNQVAASSGDAQRASPVSDDANTQYMRQVSNQGVDVSHTMKLSPLNALVAEGSLIHATLETATSSDLPGYLRAMVNQPVYAEDGSQILIPSGSRLIGQYKSGMLQGQSRIFVVWTRLITATGYSITLGSPGVDNLGMAGMGADSVNRHFWARFGQASLLSLLGAGTASVGGGEQSQQTGSGMYREAIASSFSQSANEALQKDTQIAPTLETYQGKPVMVFVAKDLNFQNAVQDHQTTKNIF
jgi:type IV secretion system protein VirB10